MVDVIKDAHAGPGRGAGGELQLRAQPPEARARTAPRPSGRLHAWETARRAPALLVTLPIGSQAQRAGQRRARRGAAAMRAGAPTPYDRVPRARHLLSTPLPDSPPCVEPSTTPSGRWCAEGGSRAFGAGGQRISKYSFCEALRFFRRFSTISRPRKHLACFEAAGCVGGVAEGRCHLVSFGVTAPNSQDALSSRRSVR